MHRVPINMQMHPGYFKMENNVQDPITDLLSHALRITFQDYCNGCMAARTMFGQENAQSQGRSQKRVSQPEIIFISDDQQEQIHKYSIDKKQTKEYQVRVSFLDQEEEESLLKKKELKTQDFSPCISKSANKAQNAMEEEPIVEENDEVFVAETDFLIGCPSIGMKNSQIEQKKMKLMARRVRDWGQVQTKGRKQKREISMLKK